MSASPLPRDAEPAAAAAPEHGAYRWYVLGVLFLVTLFNVADRNILHTLLQPIKEEFGASDTAMGLLIGFNFAIVHILASVVIAHFADRGVRRTIIAGGLFVWSGLTALSGLATSYLQLAVARIGVATAEGAGSSPAHSMLSDYFPLERRTTVLTLFGMGGIAGGALGSGVIGPIAQVWGWRSAFFLLGIPGALLSLLVWASVREPVRGALDASLAQRGEAERRPADTLGARRNRRGGAMSTFRSPLAGLRVIESSLLGPGLITTHLADLGAQVIKVESPEGDYIREMTWPIVNGVSLLHLHVHRGKQSIALDLRKPEGVAVYRDLARGADVVVEAMRPGSLARRGLGYDDLRAENPKIVFCNISGYGMTGPYQNLPAHGIAFDTWGGIVNAAVDDEGFCYIPEHASMGMYAGPMFGALGILAAVIRARETGSGSMLEIAQSDAAAYMDWYRIESYRAYERPQSEVTGNKSDNYERREPGTAGMRAGVRYQIYQASDGHVLFMASEQAFWKNFCACVGRLDLFEKWPGSKYADHARGNRALQAELREIFRARSCAEWIRLGDEQNFPIAPVNTPKTITDDPQFRDRFPWYSQERHGAEMLPFPVKFPGEELPEPGMAPTVGEHTEAVCRSVLGYDAERIAALRRAGAFGNA